jgi:Protein of unknown function (DUF2934)
MARMRQQRTEEEPTGQAEDILNAPPETDWRRMTDAAYDDIARCAYELYERRGCEPGHELDDWLRAEHKLQQRRSAE